MKGLVVLFCLLAAAICARDYYEILGVKRDATKAEIKKAYRKLSLKFSFIARSLGFPLPFHPSTFFWLCCHPINVHVLCIALCGVTFSFHFISCVLFVNPYIIIRTSSGSTRTKEGTQRNMPKSQTVLLCFLLSAPLLSSFTCTPRLCASHSIRGPQRRHKAQQVRSQRRGGPERERCGAAQSLRVRLFWRRGERTEQAPAPPSPAPRSVLGGPLQRQDAPGMSLPLHLCSRNCLICSFLCWCLCRA